MMATEELRAAPKATLRGDYSNVDNVDEDCVEGEEEEGEVRSDGHHAAAVASDALVKHPLHNVWALWYYKNDKKHDWSANQKVITTFSSVEDFWALYNYIQPASKLAPGCDYSLFKEGIRPMWEDEHNKRGGRWLVNLDRRRRGAELDRFWLETLLCLIGEAFDDLSDEICGAVVNLRAKGDKLGLWTRDASKADANVKIGKMLKSRLSIPQDLLLDYQAHTDTMVKTGSMAKHRYVV